MGRAILAVIVGYLTLFVVTFVTFTVAYLTMGTEGAFKPESFEPSGAWITVMFVFGAIAAVAGGFVCTAIAKSAKPTLVLAALVLVLGLLMAIPVLTATDEGPTVRSGDLDNFEAMQNARQPGWVALFNPLIGAAGVFLGSKLRRQQA